MIDEKKLIEDIEKEFDGVCVYDVSPSQAVNDFVEIVDRQPKVGEWIPCGERLPDEEGEYLASREHYEGYEIQILSFDPEDGIDVEFWKDEVDAWSPLPAPFIESED